MNEIIGSLRPTKTISVAGRSLILEVSLDRTRVIIRSNVDRVGSKPPIGHVTFEDFNPLKFIGAHTNYVVQLARKFLLEMQADNKEPTVKDQKMKLNAQIGKCYLVEVSVANQTTVRLIRSNIKKDLAIRLLTHATINKSRVFGQANVTLINGVDNDFDTFGSHVSPKLLVNDGIDGRYFCLLSNKYEAMELIKEYKEDPKYKDKKNEVPNGYEHQLVDTKNYINNVDALEKLINERWPTKETAVEERIVEAKEEFIKRTSNPVKQVTVSKAEFIRKNPQLSVAELVEKGNSVGMNLKPTYIYNIRTESKIVNNG